MRRINDLPIWMRLLRALWLILIPAWTGLITWAANEQRQTAIDQAEAARLHHEDLDDRFRTAEPELLPPVGVGFDHRDGAEPALADRNLRFALPLGLLAGRRSRSDRAATRNQQRRQRASEQCLCTHLGIPPFPVAPV